MHGFLIGYFNELVILKYFANRENTREQHFLTVQ